METRIRQIADILYVPLPPEIVSAVNLQSESLVDVALVNGDVIVHPAANHSHSLEQLLADITDDNIHREVEFGAAVGKEVW